MESQKKPRTIQGVVISDKMEKTIVVAVKTRVTLPGIGKIIRRTTKYKVHDEKKTAHVGDLVVAKEVRPLSRHKRHTLLKVLERAK